MPGLAGERIRQVADDGKGETKDDVQSEIMSRALTASRHLSLVLRFVLGTVFIYAGTVKIIDPYAFSEAISNYDFFHPFLVNPIAVMLPWIELIAGLCLIVGWCAGGGAMIVGLLATAFGLLTGMAIIRGLDIACGCFSLGDEQKAVQWTHIAENVLFLAMALQILFIQQINRKDLSVFRESR